MQNAYVVTSTLTDARTVTLDEEIPMASARVRLVVEALVAAAQRLTNDHRLDQYSDIAIEVVHP